MATTHKAAGSDTVKIVGLVCVIVVALVIMVVYYLRSNTTSGTIQSGPVQHIRAGARDKPRSP